jgi:hypothetical protein
MTAFISIEYNEGNKGNLAYKHVSISYDNEKKEFSSGNFVVDWFNAKKFFVQELNEKVDYMVQSSSVDNFIMDGAPYDSAYLHFVDDKPVLKYLDRTDKYWFFDKEKIADGMEIFVPENTKPTWEELKEMVKEFENL